MNDSKPKRYFLIVLRDRRRFKFDLERIMPDVPDTVAPGDIRILKAASDISIEGFCADEHAKRPRWISGSSIKFIDIIFEKAPDTNSNLK